MSRSQLTKREARNKGLVTLAVGAGSVAAFVFLHWFVGLIGLGATAYFGYNWLKFRGKWGMRF
ncbi:MAG: hypothetical protein RBU37_09890 [Myxococcota bacterium]|nr:hypothetical protein [Myxococcota bacterium]